MDPLREQLRRAGCPVAADDTVLLHHATNAQGAAGILSERFLRAPDGGGFVYVSTSPAIASLLPDSEIVIAVRARLDELIESRDWLDHDDELVRRFDYAVRVADNGTYRPVAVGRDAYDAKT